MYIGRTELINAWLLTHKELLLFSAIININMLDSVLPEVQVTSWLGFFLLDLQKGAYHTQEIFGGGKYWRIWRIRGNSPNFYPPNVLVVPPK